MSRAKLSHVYYTMLLLKSQPKITSSGMGPLFSRQLAKDCVFKDKKYVFLSIDLLSPIFSKLPIGKRPSRWSLPPSQQIAVQGSRSSFTT